MVLLINGLKQGLTKQEKRIGNTEGEVDSIYNTRPKKMIFLFPKKRLKNNKFIITKA